VSVTPAVSLKVEGRRTPLYFGSGVHGCGGWIRTESTILIGRIINLLREEAEEIEVPTIDDVSPDPGDDPVCACAEHGQADFIATLNKKDFP